MCWRWQRGQTGRWLPAVRSARTPELRVLLLSALCVPLVVAGANRLNNGAGDEISLVGLAGVAPAFGMLVWWRATVIRDSVVSIAVYLLGLSLLLSTSLRGWYVTGHDIQHEYTVFQLTKDNGYWNPGASTTPTTPASASPFCPPRSGNSCGWTIPTSSRCSSSSFRPCPVMVYLLARRYSSKHVAILAVVYFVSFPTFFNDMPFLNRQEIAFVFLGLAYPVTRRQWSARRRRLVVVVFGLGMGLCHYSTIYVFIGTLGIAWILERVLTLLERSRRQERGPRHRTRAGWSDATRIVTPLVIASPRSWRICGEAPSPSPPEG